MVSTCCAFGCTYRHNKELAVGMYRFPKDLSRRQAWVNAIRRKDWQPNNGTRICGKHFQTGKPSKDKNHPDYVPNVFCYTKINLKSAVEYENQKATFQPQIIVLEKVKNEEYSDCSLSTLSAKGGGFGIENNYKDSSGIEYILPGTSEQITFEPQTTSEQTTSEQMITMSLCAYQNTVSKLRAENERLESELRSLKINNKVVDIAFEMNALREEIRTLKDKLAQAQFATLLMSDNKKLEYYTGISNLDNFNNILYSTKDLVDTSFAIPKEHQLLIMLVKLKMKFQDEDLAVRFNVSKRTVRRVIASWMPILSLELEE